MGVVYRARDTRLNRDVAIKVLPELVAKPERLSRFEQEAKAVAALNHPNIVSVYQMGTYLGVPYLVSELLEGKTLAETLQAGPLSQRKAVDYGVQIARGLAAAHDKGIVHRDLKPANLFLSKDGRVKILDFGVAIMVHPQASDTDVQTLTLPGSTSGTPGYMSPEQVRGLATDQRSDIFALGVVLYEMITGQRGFKRATSADTMSAILHEETEPISQSVPGVPPALEKVIRHCLEKLPEQRFQSASDLAFALETLSDPAISAPAGPAHGGKSNGRHVAFAAATAVAALLGAGVLGYFLMRPAPVPTVSNYVQLTHDGQPKSLIGTDGARLYMALGEGGTGSFTSTGIAQMSTSGGELQRLSILPSAGMVPASLSPGWIGTFGHRRARLASARTSVGHSCSGSISAQAGRYGGRNCGLVPRRQDAGLQRFERLVRGEGRRDGSTQAAGRKRGHQKCQLVSGQQPAAIRRDGERRKPGTPSAVGNVRGRNGTASHDARLARLRR